MSDTGEVNIKRDRLVITASSLGTVFEWYDFFVYGTLAALIGKLFFPAGSDSAAFLKALAVFGVGFGVRPLGALLFGVLGDKLDDATAIARLNEPGLPLKARLRRLLYLGA